MVVARGMQTISKHWRIVRMHVLKVSIIVIMKGDRPALTSLWRSEMD